VKLVNDLPADLLFYGDFPLLQELFHNLASNAVKFCRKGDVVRFHSPSAEEGLVAITDTGVGIDPKILPDLFRHEVKTSTYGTDEEPGSGFGLPLCGDIVRMHGGTISAESEPGRGSTFTVRLPIVRPSVLIVDDDRQMRLLVAKLLSPLRCAVREAASGAEAMKSIRSSPPHVIISDLQMPEMDGYGLLAELQKDSALKKIPVIVMTGLGIEERTRAFELGASDFIAKPIDTADLLPRVKHFIGG
jgi:CheY-like chemotaxis protein